MTIHVACQSDSRFAPDCAVMLHSLLTANPDEEFVVHFLHDRRLPAADHERLGEVVSGFGGEWRSQLVGDELVDGFPVLERYGGVTAWLRLLLPRLLGDEVRVLYLDADLLIRRPIRPLWETDLQGQGLAAATQPVLGADRRRVVEDLKLPAPDRYFNSGVMLLDLVKLRDPQLMPEAERIARERSVPTPWADQEPLNAALWRERVDLHPRWNVMNPCFDLPSRLLPWPAQQVREALADPAIIHFIGPYKPWHYRLRHPYKALYFEHLAQTPWRSRNEVGRTRRQTALRALPPRAAMRAEQLEHRLKLARRTAAPNLMRVLGDSLRRNRRLYAWTRSTYRTVRPSGAPGAVADLLDAIADSVEEVCFIQIGSNDADHNDPLRSHVERHGWRGVLVEPVPYVFERLRRRYRDNPRITPVNVAVGDRDGELPFYYVGESDDPSLPEWYDQIGSFVLENVLHPYHVEHIPGLRERIVQAEVPSLTFESLWERHPMPRLDIVHVDAEGYDDQILGQIDLIRHRPLLLLYEHKHLPATRLDTLTSRLREAGYELLMQGPDTAAVRRDAPALVRMALRRARRRASAVT